MISFSIFYLIGVGSRYFLIENLVFLFIGCMVYICFWYFWLLGVKYCLRYGGGKDEWYVVFIFKGITFKRKIGKCKVFEKNDGKCRDKVRVYEYFLN